MRAASRFTLLVFSAIFLVGALAAQSGGAGETKSAKPRDPSHPVSSSPSPPESSQKDRGPVQLMVAVVLSAAAAALRVFQRFRRFSDLGIFGNWYTWSFIGFTAILSGATYTGLASWLTSIMAGGTMAVGASGIGHGLLAIGRLGRPGKKATVPGDETRNEAAPVNQLIDFFYEGVRVHLQERMHVRAKALARGFELDSIIQVACELLRDEMGTKALSEAEGNKTIAKIRALPATQDPGKDAKYEALRLTIVSASYGQLISRLRAGLAK